MEERWTRKGLFRFTFNIQTMDDKTNLGTKEAHDHAFSHKTSNWGWAQFAKRDHVYYKNAEVIRDDGYLISVTITSSPEKPKIAKPISHTVPPVLVQAMGSLLDDPEHSDVVFYLHSSRRRGNGKSRKAEVKKVYAIRKILAARSEYFRDMFESGFQEAEAEESSSEEESAAPQSRVKSFKVMQVPAHPQRSHHAAARAEQANRAMDSEEEEERGEEEEDEMEEEDYDDPDAIMEDSDEDFEEMETDRMLGNISHLTNFMGEDNSPNEDEEEDSEEEQEDEEDEGEERDEGRVNDEMIDTDEEGDANTTGNDAVPTPTRSVELKPRSASSRKSSTATFVDAASNHGIDMVRSSSGNDEFDAVVEQQTSLTESIGSKIEHLAASTPRHKRGNASSSRTKRDRSRTNEASTIQAREAPTEIKQRQSGVHRRKRRKVSIVDSAYPTFKALLFFLYTDTVEFAPLTSSFLPSDVAADDAPNKVTTASLFVAATSSTRRGREPSGRFIEEMQKARRKRRTVIESHINGYPDKPSPCSAKATYRLADKLDIPDLKKRAQEHIAMSLTIQNIVWEVFSGFTAQYPDILKMETDFLLKHWPQVKRINAMKSIFLRSSAHPGLAKVWPYLLDCLEYRQPDVDDTEDTIL